jgi:uncharacterized protein YndB with AHSA1/START domain
MKTINQTYELNATPTAVFEALISPEIIEQWSGAPAKMEAKSGTNFSLFGGQVEGTNLEVIANQKLVQTWPHDTKVTITLAVNGDATTVELLHEDIPGSEAEELFNQGWKNHYFGPLQTFFAG